MIKIFEDFLKRPEDPYGEEIWDEDRMIIKNLYVIYVIGQDMNFLCQKKFKMGKRGWKDYYYEMASKIRGQISFDSNCTVRDAYDVHNREGVLNGTEVVGYIELFNRTRYDTLQNLCDILRIPIDNVKLYNGY
jgi:hypothetical protein